METPAIVDNAADRFQTRAAERRSRQKAQRQANDLRVVLSTPEGRRFLWRLMGECGSFASVCRDGFDSSVFYRGGKQDVGHMLQVWVLDANEGAYLTMQKEAWANDRKEISEAQAEAEALKQVHSDTAEQEL